MGTLSEALGNLHLTSPAEPDVAPDPSPAEAPVRGACHVKCVCYGVGNFATCVTARTQLAFLLLFLEKCQVSFGFLRTSPAPGLAHRVLLGFG